MDRKTGEDKIEKADIETKKAAIREETGIRTETKAAIKAGIKRVATKTVEIVHREIEVVA